ncbi:ABC transporter ATP-binding protein [Chlamydia trachomatis]|uniref:ABC Transport ATPase n=2 Tax=Chlamydia trachomatis TaxID=813 RepID=O84696_CHLTR|nr:ABC transporter ATP-binding protein [Chlamydia trachomatis]NP_220209.1 oligopeptide ABC transporter ATP-binding protein [Chlamydia trachomatis D/UW-3/CX]AAC68285.1 ABC Transport ATPase [Chlamydia trachomatis D/UW-3/CX]ADH18408.1 peptide ABC transporter ATPase [Chlamydia trachomatis G/9768]ADH19333.1 peptide ABC transporter ATPase [Chlamydia trachomatis G/11222]ADH20255.1 peptide ABC transporter ATPase [Chlamydia trachomatis G/11074]ADH97353.1 peptide ABC transporter ATPase [Chlamydia trach
MCAQPLLQVKNLSVSLNRNRVSFLAVDSLSFDVFPGQTLAIIGESGSGKSITAQSLMQLLPEENFSLSGEALFNKENLLDRKNTNAKVLFGSKISMIFQNPLASFDPVFTIEQQFHEVIRTHLGISNKMAHEQMLAVLRETGFQDPERCIKLYPHELSGGMLQRMAIAMTLLTSPDLLIADEPTTALDVSVQYQILQLLKTLQKKTGMSLLIITHDMGVVAEMADDVFVLYAGRMAEYSSVQEIFHSPAHPYTEDLLASRPSQYRQQTFVPIAGQPPHYTSLPKGCCYSPRCRKAQPICFEKSPDSLSLNDHHRVRCWLYE